MTTPGVTEMMEAYALDAVDHARDAVGVELDFSRESMEQVEGILAVMYEARPKGFLARLLRRGPPPEAVASFSKMYGGYLGEVLRRHHGGDWIADEETVPGGRVVALQKGEARIWPTMKIGKRLENGPEDNVWDYFRILTEEMWPADE